MLNNEGITTACQSDINAAIMMKVLNILSDQPPIFADLNYIDRQTRVARVINCGSMPTSLAKSRGDVDWGFQYEYMGKARGACPVFCCKGGQVTICTLGRIKGKYLLQIAQGEAFEQPKSRFSEVRDIWPQAFIKMNCDVDEYYQNLRSNHIVVGYGDLVEELINYCEIANISYVFNKSRINTVVVCSLTSNLQRAESPGNVLLEKGEANLPKPSVVSITQIFTVNKQDLSEKIGSISRNRMAQVLEGIDLLIRPRDIKE